MNQFSDKQLKDNLEKILKQNQYPKEIWVFAYGALMWAPCFEPEVTLTGALKGWARKPCLLTLTARGSKQKPGIVFALDKAQRSYCHGLIFRIDQSRLESDLLNLWRREMPVGLYKPTWLPVTTETKEIMALCFVVNRDHKLFIKRVSKNDLIYAIANAHGEYGTCLEYYQKTLNSLTKLGLEDNYIHKLVTAAVANSTI